MAPPPRAADLPFSRVACGLTKTPPLIRMIASRFQRSLASACPRCRRIGLFIAQILLVIGFLSGCQSRTVAEKESARAPRVAALAKAPEPPSVTPKPKPSVLSSQRDKVQYDPALTPKAETTTEQVGARLRSSFDVQIEGADTLLVGKASASSEMPSLFEEAIILGKLRAFLKSSTATAPNTSVSFHNGQATVTLPSTINSGTASVLIAKMLSLDGVNVARAVFGK